MLNIRIMISIVLFLATGQAYSQSFPQTGPCPGGAVPSNGRCVSPAEAAANRGSGTSRPAYTEVWEDRYGAIAVDPKSGTMGAAEGASSRRRAINEALKLCGNSGCVAMAHVRNGCLASAWGGRTGYYKFAEDIQTAENKAIQACWGEFSDCRLTYSYCSLPVRVR